MTDIKSKKTLSYAKWERRKTGLCPSTLLYCPILIKHCLSYLYAFVNFVTFSSMIIFAHLILFLVLCTWKTLIHFFVTQCDNSKRSSLTSACHSPHVHNLAGTVSKLSQPPFQSPSSLILLASHGRMTWLLQIRHKLHFNVREIVFVRQESSLFPCYSLAGIEHRHNGRGYVSSLVTIMGTARDSERPGLCYA